MGFNSEGFYFSLFREPSGLNTFAGPVWFAKLCSFSRWDPAQACGVIWKNNFQCLLLGWALIPPLLDRLNPTACVWKAKSELYVLLSGKPHFHAPRDRCSSITLCNRLLDPQILGATGNVSCNHLMRLKAYNDYTATWWIRLDNNILPFVWHLVAYKVRIHYLVCSSQ